jgi:hypothetical protein
MARRVDDRLCETRNAEGAVVSGADVNKWCDMDFSKGRRRYIFTSILVWILLSYLNDGNDRWYVSRATGPAHTTTGQFT